MERKPDWLKNSIRKNENYSSVRKILQNYKVNTICDEAHCPNEGECFNKNIATFMILGRKCTRNCQFCAVTKQEPEEVKEDEPQNVAMAVKELRLKYVVVTSVTRDDLPDGGASHFHKTIREIKELSPETVVEVLIPDFKGDINALRVVANAKPDVISHNVETVASLYPQMRPMANYARSIKVIENIKKLDRSIISKSGIMLGVGETEDEVISVFSGLLKAGCEILTIGQYLAPSKEHHPVIKYVLPQTFLNYKQKAEDMGFLFCASSPLTRSSYLADEGFLKAVNLKINRE